MTGWKWGIIVALSLKHQHFKVNIVALSPAIVASETQLFPAHLSMAAVARCGGGVSLSVSSHRCWTPRNRKVVDMAEDRGGKNICGLE